MTDVETSVAPSSGVVPGATEPITDAEVEAYAQELYDQSARAAQVDADTDPNRQTLVAQGLLNQPHYPLWVELTAHPKLLWLAHARQLLEA
jgi:hypothetical protein